MNDGTFFLHASILWFSLSTHCDHLYLFPLSLLFPARNWSSPPPFLSSITFTRGCSFLFFSSKNVSTICILKHDPILESYLFSDSITFFSVSVTCFGFLLFFLCAAEKRKEGVTRATNYPAIHFGYECESGVRMDFVPIPALPLFRF